MKSNLLFRLYFSVVSREAGIHLIRSFIAPPYYEKNDSSSPLSVMFYRPSGASDLPTER